MGFILNGIISLFGLDMASIHDVSRLLDTLWMGALCFVPIITHFFYGLMYFSSICCHQYWWEVVDWIQRDSTHWVMWQSLRCYETITAKSSKKWISKICISIYLTHFISGIWHSSPACVMKYFAPMLANDIWNPTPCIGFHQARDINSLRASSAHISRRGACLPMLYLIGWRRMRTKPLS